MDRFRDSRQYLVVGIGVEGLVFVEHVLVKTEVSGVEEAAHIALEVEHCRPSNVVCIIKSDSYLQTLLFVEVDCVLLVELKAIDVF